MTTAKQILRQEFGSSKNPMTERVLKIGKIHPAVAFEISTGEFMGRTLFGVSLAGHDGAGQTYRGYEPWASAFSTRQEAESHVERVRRLIRGQDARTLAHWLTSVTKLPSEGV